MQVALVTGARPPASPPAARPQGALETAPDNARALAFAVVATANHYDAGVHRIVESTHDDAVRLLGEHRETLDEADVHRPARGRPVPRPVIDPRPPEGDPAAPPSP